MVNHGHEKDDGPAIARVGFYPPGEAGPGLDFEALDLAELRTRVAAEELRRPHRTDFHTITLITRGRGEHTVDFVTYACRPGTLLWVRPGQVQRFSPHGGLDGPQLLFTAAFPPRFSRAAHLIDERFGPTRWQLDTPADYAAVTALVSQLRAEYARPRGTVSGEILQFLLAAVMLQIERLPNDGAIDPRTAHGEVFARFRTELERSYTTTRRAEDYAARLGYTVKTLTRACHAAAGRPVKHLIDDRVILEAKRLLAHTDDPVSAIARGLGFTEPTNFGKFFTRHTGTAPGEFRRTSRDR